MKKCDYHHSTAPFCGLTGMLQRILKECTCPCEERRGVGSAMTHCILQKASNNAQCVITVHGDSQLGCILCVGVSPFLFTDNMIVYPIDT
mmetsp:Transcript_3418/g.4922  ORF Transcript_3418/g.4922 Transcript_3418/m.4922 type:complete len:90 (+) Transcript_3418:43-312(+)